MCATWIREGLLNIHIHYLHRCTALERKEIMVIGAAVALILYTAVLGALGPAMSALQSNRTISNAGSVTAIGVEVYSDQACNNPVTSISWGTIDPGSSVNKTVYIKNTGNNAVTLSLATSNWNPSNAPSYMTLSWNYNGQPINANAVIQVKLTLSVLSSVSGITNFSFDITIVATG
jgi:hypothetical protein